MLNLKIVLYLEKTVKLININEEINNKIKSLKNVLEVNKYESMYKNMQKNRNEA